MQLNFCQFSEEPIKRNQAVPYLNCLDLRTMCATEKGILSPYTGSAWQGNPGGHCSSTQ